MTQKIEIICVTTDSVPGYDIREVRGVVWGVAVTNRHGDPSVQVNAADNARTSAFNILQKRALLLGANGIVGIFADSFVARGGGSGSSHVDREYACYGTAVTLVPKDAGGTG